MKEKRQETRMLKNYVIIDLETTGLRADTDKIIEIGAIKVEDGHETIYHSFVNPKIPISERIIEIVGITDEMVKDAPEIGDIIGGFIEFTEELPLLGHNLMFDFGFLKTAAVQNGYQFQKNGLDTLDIARKYLPELETRRLDYLCEYFGIQEEQHHRAWNDAKVTGELYRILCERFENTENENKKIFEPKELHFEVKKKSPITPRQKSYLNSLLLRHSIKPDYVIDELTKSEASRIIDQILSEYGMR